MNASKTHFLAQKALPTRDSNRITELRVHASAEARDGRID